MSSTYSQEQQIHSLSSIANAAFGEEFPQPNAFENLQNYVTTVITETLTQDQGTLGGNYLGSTADNTAWQIIWGPAVFSNDKGSNTVVSDNTMTLFYNASQNLFVVTIAGTNGVSSFGWISEDFDVSTTVAWNTVNAGTKAPATAAIAAGSNLGLSKLLGMTDPESGNTMIETLKTYLTNDVTSGTPQTVAVAGHSLGGALTPVMALYLYETVSTWADGKVSSVEAYPTAGPTPGNADFATYYEGLVSTGGSVKFTYTAKYNTIDVVPQAWELDTLSAAPFLYSTNLPKQTTPSDIMAASLVAGAITASVNTSNLKFYNYTHIAPRTALTGTYMSPIRIDFKEYAEIYAIEVIFRGNTTLKSSELYTPTNYITYLQNFAYFVMQMVYQHTTAYTVASMLDIADFVTEYQEIRSKVPAPGGAAIPQHTKVSKNLIAKFTGIHLDKMPAQLGESILPENQVEQKTA